MVNVRAATPQDAEGVLKIYAPHVLHSAVTFETVVPSAEEFQARIGKCLQKFPWLVCEVNGEIAGYAYASTHREREAYQWTCECSVYVNEGFKSKGVGEALYRTLFQILKEQGLVNLYAGITLPNEASIKLHEKCGFVKFAEYDNIGYKSGTWHNVGWWKLLLNGHRQELPPLISFPQLSSSQLLVLFEQSAGAIKEKLRS